MLVIEHLSNTDTIYLYYRNLNEEVYLHIMILKLTSMICIEIYMQKYISVGRFYS